MSDYPNNSYKYKEKMKEQAEKQPIAKVASGKIKKKSEARKLADVFIAEDIHSVKSYIITDVVIPAIANAIEDVVVKGIRMILRGETEPHAKKRSGEFVDYRRMSDRDRRDDRREPKARTRSFDLDDISFETRGEAEMVLDRMEAIIEEYGRVSIVDLYDIADLGTPPYTADKYGWTSLRYAEVVRRSGEYYIKLPRAVTID